MLFMKLPNKILEKKLLSSDYDLVIGVDEVGMGCLAGPVVVCAVAFDKKFFDKVHPDLHGIRDSKLLSPSQREEFAKELMKEKDLSFKITYCHPKIIDKINIYQAARLAMRKAVKKLIGKSAIHPPENSRARVTTERERGSGEPSRANPGSRVGGMADLPKAIVLIDGKTKINGLNFDQQAIVKGDQKVFTIACASILAKVFRDKMMIKYAKKFPNYGFEKHKGYGTKDHLEKLIKHGPCAIHRCSFSPVAKLVKI